MGQKNKDLLDFYDNFFSSMIVLVEMKKWRNKKLEGR
jgi:hypothetical protein